MRDQRTQTEEAWNRNAEFWNEHMGEGNNFFKILLWPAIEKMLQPKRGERLLDVACGNGVVSRLLAAGNSEVTAFDVSSAMIAIARRHPSQFEIDYRVIDATDRAALVELGPGIFDGALCNMALMDMPEIEPLMTALTVLLKPGGRFVFSVLHPCFNNPAAIQMSELEDRNGTFVTTHSVKIARYQTPFTRIGLAMQGQPVPHFYFHRSLSLLLAPALSAGFMFDGFEERAFPAEKTGSAGSLSWDGRFSEIPAAVIVRLRRTI